MIETPLAFIAGFGLGWLARGSDKPIRMPRLVRWGYTSPVPGPMPETTISQWDLYVTAFAFHGNQLRFSEREMTERQGVCTSTAYDRYKALLRDAGVIVTEKRRATQWAPTWNYSSFRMAIKHGHLALPYPAGNPPALNTRGWTPQTPHRTSDTAGGAQ
jgi:hypothetical protein